jgi:hypothetical protein
LYALNANGTITRGSAQTQNSDNAKIVELNRKDRSRDSVFWISHDKNLRRIDGMHIMKIKGTPGNNHEISRKADVRKK